MRTFFFIASAIIYYFNGNPLQTHTNHNTDETYENSVKETMVESQNQFETYTGFANTSSEFGDATSESEEDFEETEGNHEESEDQGHYTPDDNPVTWDEDPDNFPLETPTTYDNVDDEEVQSPTHYREIPPGACAICGDGTYSFSKNRRGTCSRHGGVAEWLRQL